LGAEKHGAPPSGQDKRAFFSARRRGVNESLEDFAVKFQKTDAAASINRSN
jgi:hypothetical protein